MSAVGVCTWADRLPGLVHTTEPADYRELASLMLVAPCCATAAAYGPMLLHG